MKKFEFLNQFPDSALVVKNTGEVVFKTTLLNVNSKTFQN